MNLAELSAEYLALRGASGIVLDDAETLDCFVRATRSYAAWGGVRALDMGDALPEAKPRPVAPVLPTAYAQLPAASPVKDLTLISSDTEITVGEWEVIRPLAVLYVELENGRRLEAARANGIEFFGRDVASVAADIAAYEASLPSRSFVHPVITIE